MAGVAGLAFFPAFLFMVWWIVAGGWLIASSRRGTAASLTAQPGG